MNEYNYNLAVELRHELHKHPELSNQEKWTKGYLMDFLNTHTSLEVVDRGKWFYALYHGQRGETLEYAKAPIAFRADFDAIAVTEPADLPYCSQNPGVAHKCGHDGHSATLCALALEINEKSVGQGQQDQENTDEKEINRDIYFVFQHAEETGDGAETSSKIIEEFGIEEVYAIHNLPGAEFASFGIRNGTICCASKGMEIIYHGVSSHASEPEKGKNPAFAIAEIIRRIPEITVAEEHDGLILCTVIQVDVGERAFGVSAHEGKLLMTIRAQQETELDALQNNLEDIAVKQAKEYGIECEIKYNDVFPETRNHEESIDKIRKIASKMKCPINEMESPLRTSEDFGYFLKRAKGAMVWLGSGEKQSALHSVEFDFNDELIPIGVDLFKNLI